MILVKKTFGKKSEEMKNVRLPSYQQKHTCMNIKVTSTKHRHSKHIFMYTSTKKYTQAHIYMYIYNSLNTHLNIKTNMHTNTLTIHTNTSFSHNLKTKVLHKHNIVPSICLAPHNFINNVIDSIFLCSNPKV